MKQQVKNTILIALGMAGAFGLGMWFMYLILWGEVFTKLIEMTEKVFK